MCIYTDSLLWEKPVSLTIVLSGTVTKLRDSSEGEWRFRRIQSKTMDNEENTIFLSLKGTKSGRSWSSRWANTSFVFCMLLEDITNRLYRFSLLKLEMTPEVFLQPSRQPYTIVGNDWWHEAQPQANTGSPFKGVCFICFALSFDYFFVSCVASNKIQRALLEDILPRFAATMNSPIILVYYDLFLTYNACW